MQCRYVIDTEVHIPWAPDIEVRQPLVIKPTDDKEVGDHDLEIVTP